METPSEKPRRNVRIPAPEQVSEWQLRTQGNCTTLKRQWNYRLQLNLPGRGDVGLFSRASRYRMLRMLSTVDWLAMGPALLITLTYPDGSVDRPYQQRTTDRTLFHRRVEAFLGSPTPALWRVEFQLRKSGPLKDKLVPHLHILTFTSAYIPWQDIRAWWRAILGHEGPLATDVRRARTGQGAAYYASKYVAKAPSTSLDFSAYLDRNPGRQWGWLRKPHVQFQPKEVLRAVPARLAKRFQLLAAEILQGYDPLSEQSVTLLGLAGVAGGNDIKRGMLDGGAQGG